MLQKIAQEMEAIEEFGISWPALIGQFLLLGFTLFAIRHAWKHESGTGFLFWLIFILAIPVVGSLAAFMCLPTTKSWTETHGQKQRAIKSARSTRSPSAVD